MGYEIKEFNPTKHKLSLNLTKYDCYSLRKGICSLYLGEEEAQRISEEEKKDFNSESDVMYCRDIARSLLKDNYFENPDFQMKTNCIQMFLGSCGHCGFVDGQHRTCIAKHLNIQSMFAEFEVGYEERKIKCNACNIKKNYSLVDNIKRIFKRELPSYFIDEDYMHHRKT